MLKARAGVILVAAVMVTAGEAGAATLPPSNPPGNIARNPDFIATCASGPGVTDNSQPCIAATLQAINNARSQEAVGPMVLPAHFATMPPEQQLLAVIDRERVDRGLPPFAGSVAELTMAAQAGAHAAQDPSVTMPSYAGNAWKGTSEYSGSMVNALGAAYFWMYRDGWGGSTSSTENVDCTSATAPGCWGHRDGILDPYNNLPHLTMGGALDPSASNGKQAWTLDLMGTNGAPPGYTFTWTDILADTPGTAGGCGVAPPPSGKVGRLAGDDREGTAILASRQSYPQNGSAQVAVLASDANFPDALAGGPLAAAKSGPLLITPRTVLAPSVETEIQRVLPSGATVYVLGGALALDPGIDGRLTADGYHVTRIAGSDRFATAVQIANAIGTPATILEATGLGFADALAAGPAAAVTRGAILLTDGTQQSDATAAYLAGRSGPRYAIGGPAAAADPSATGIAGGDRYETAVRVTTQFFSSPKTVAFATGAGFPDALAGGPAIAKAGGGMLLVPKCPPVPTAVTGYLQSLSTAVSSATLFGGAVAVSDDTLTQIDQALTPAS